MLRAFALTLALVAAPAFAKPKAPVKDTKDVPGTVKWFCAQYETAFANARLAACSATDRKASQAKAFATEASHEQQQCLEVINSALGQKRQRFHSDLAKRCIAAHVVFAKDPTGAHRAAATEACREVVHGLKATGESCESPLDCGDGLSCIGPKGAPPGTCVAPLAEGENCDNDVLGASSFVSFMQRGRNLCAAGLHCSQELNAARACVKDKPEGAKTDGPRQAAGAHCQDDGDCKGLCRAGVCAAVCGSG